MPRSRIPAEEEARRRELHAQGYTPAQIAKMTGLTVWAVHNWLSRRGLVPHVDPKRVAAVERGRKIRELHSRGYSKEEIAEKLDLPLAYVRKYFRQRGGGRHLHGKFYRYDVSKRPDHERRFLRMFFSDLVRLTAESGKVPDIGIFMKEWRKAHGEGKIRACPYQ